MARISSYPIDTVVQDKDAWIGSDATTRATKQYTAESLAAYINAKLEVNISGQMSFKFVDDATGARDFSGPADGSNIIDITTLQLSIVDNGDQNIVAFMEYLVGNNILIGEADAISTFGHFTIDSYTATAGSAVLYTLNLTNLGGNGVLTEDKLYAFTLFTLSSNTGSTFTFNQPAPGAATWVINHNLGKFPSITVVDTSNVIVYGESTYTNNNSVTLSFAGNVAGKAYLN